MPRFTGSIGGRVAPPGPGDFPTATPADFGAAIGQGITDISDAGQDIINVKRRKEADVLERVAERNAAIDASVAGSTAFNEARQAIATGREEMAGMDLHDAGEANKTHFKDTAELVDGIFASHAEGMDQRTADKFSVGVLNKREALLSEATTFQVVNGRAINTKKLLRSADLVISSMDERPESLMTALDNLSEINNTAILSGIDIGIEDLSDLAVESFYTPIMTEDPFRAEAMFSAGVGVDAMTPDTKKRLGENINTLVKEFPDKVAFQTAIAGVQSNMELYQNVVLGRVTEGDLSRRAQLPPDDPDFIDEDTRALLTEIASGSVPVAVQENIQSVLRGKLGAIAAEIDARENPSKGKGGGLLGRVFDSATADKFTVQELLQLRVDVLELVTDGLDTTAANAVYGNIGSALVNAFEREAGKKVDGGKVPGRWKEGRGVAFGLITQIERFGNESSRQLDAYIDGLGDVQGRLARPQMVLLMSELGQNVMDSEEGIPNNAADAKKVVGDMLKEASILYAEGIDPRARAVHESGGAVFIDGRRLPIAGNEKSLVTTQPRDNSPEFLSDTRLLKDNPTPENMAEFDRIWKTPGLAERVLGAR